MRKIILIGCIVSVAILLGVTYSSVVGFQSVNSNSMINSPLFGIRIRRALEGDNEEVNFNYLGKGDRINIHLPVKDSELELLDRFAHIIRLMDDNSFDRFVNLIRKYLYKRDDITEYNKEDIIITFFQIRNNPNNIIKEIDTELATESGPTACIGLCLTTDYGIKGYLNCLLFLMLAPLFILIFIGGNIIYFLTLDQKICEEGQFGFPYTISILCK